MQAKQPYSIPPPPPPLPPSPRLMPADHHPIATIERVDDAIELRHLRYFVVVAEELHFSRAAERLGLSQPPLSQQIRQLEARIGAPLFNRSRRRVELTAAGHQLYPLAIDILARLVAASAQVQRAQRGEIGELRLGFTRSTTLSVELPAAIRSLRLQWPELQLVLHEQNTFQQLDALLDGQLDVGIMRRAMLPPGLISHRLLVDPLVVVMRADDPALQDHPPGQQLALHSLAQRPFVLFARNAGTGIHDDVITLCGRAGFSPRIVQEAGEANTIIALVAAGLGVTILPASYQRVGLDELRFVSIADPAAQSEIHVVHHEQPRTAMVGRFVGLISALRR